MNHFYSPSSFIFSFDEKSIQKYRELQENHRNRRLLAAQIVGMTMQRPLRPPTHEFRSPRLLLHTLFPTLSRMSLPDNTLTAPRRGAPPIAKKSHMSRRKSVPRRENERNWLESSFVTGWFQKPHVIGVNHGVKEKWSNISKGRAFRKTTLG